MRSRNRSSKERRGSKFQHDHGIQPPDRRPISKTWVSSSSSSSPGGEEGRDAPGQRHRRGSQPAASPRRFPRPPSSLRPSRHPGPRDGAGFTHGASGPQRREPSVPRGADGALHRGRRARGRDRPDHDASNAPASPRSTRHRQEQGAQGRRSHQRCEHDSRRAARQLLRERLQPVRQRGNKVYVQAEPEFRKAQTVRALLRSQRRRTMSLSTRSSPRARRGPEFTPLQVVSRGGGDRRSRSRATPRRRRSTPWSRRPREVLPPEMSYDGRTFLTGEEGARSGPRVRAGHPPRLLVLSAQYESWGLPSACLGTPFAAFGASSASGWRHSLRAT